ncbi:MAG: hypothetical protein Ct9H300mP32_6970 [Verrucomicrobiota bacterium]|nr:MAG: hypothetical protein Ct9H300mP32_6970 [Verrucomicrobiota bacterium]
MPRAEGGAVASLDGSTLHVMYLSMFGVPYEQSLDLNTGPRRTSDPGEPTACIDCPRLANRLALR